MKYLNNTIQKTVTTQPTVPNQTQQGTFSNQLIIIPMKVFLKETIK